MYADVRMIITNINTINKIILRTKVRKKKKSVYIKEGWGFKAGVK
jgi:hypothetical protein